MRPVKKKIQLRERLRGFYEGLASGEQLKKTWPRFRPFSIVLVSLLIIIVFLAGTAGYINGQLFSAVKPGDKSPVLLTVRSGQSMASITNELKELGLIHSTWGIKLLADFTNRSNRIKAGEYILNRSMSAEDILDLLTQPVAPQITVRVTLQEGQSLAKFAQLLEQKGIINNAQSFINECVTGANYANYYFIPQLQGRNGVRYALEGFLFPDTYEFYANSTSATVIKRLLSRYADIYSPAWQARAEELGMSMNQIVTLASIIEREGRTADFAKISAVFHNRIKAGMRLESDATVQYALGVERLVLTSEELQTDSPYNTYRSAFPPGPICNPGAKAIEAALYPDQELINGKYYFFLLTNPYTGEMAYTKTADEHNRLKQQYQSLWQQYDNEHGR